MVKFYLQSGKYTRITCLFILVLVASLTAKAEDSPRLNECTFIIADYSDSLVDLPQLQKILEALDYGICISINDTVDPEKLVVQSNSEAPVYFSEFMRLIKKSIKANPDLIIPVFLEHDCSSSKISKEINELIAQRRVLFLPDNVKWPQKHEMLASNQQVLFFSFRETEDDEENIMYAWDHIAEFPESASGDPVFNGKYKNGSITEPLLMDRSLTQTPMINRTGSELYRNPLYMNHYYNCWMYTGKKPNFIFLSGDPGLFKNVIPYLNSYNQVNVEVNQNGKPLGELFWKFSPKTVTYGLCNFPYAPGEELQLEPVYPGFSFEPRRIQINTVKESKKKYDFRAIPLNVKTKMEAYFPFDNSIENVITGDVPQIAEGYFFENDHQKGSVIFLNDTSKIVIDPATTYHLRNNSFTVSVWMKHTKLKSNTEHYILGTNETVYRRGLRLLIKKSKPHFSFFGNDTEAQQSLAENEWCHLVFRYNLFNGEQAIFLDSKKIASTLNMPSLLGDSNIVVGSFDGMNRYFIGYMDDLAIWSRALGDEEIANIYEDGIQITKRNTKAWLLGSFILIVLSIGLYIVYKNIQPKRRVNVPLIKHAEAVVIDEEQPNTILFFGDFKITNMQGEDITNKFTAKSKELFLLLMLQPTNNNKGITTNEIIEIMWPGVIKSKALNNRGYLFNKLRKTIDELDGCEIVLEDGYWNISLSPKVYCDYLELQKLTQNIKEYSLQSLSSYYSYVKRGRFLHGIEYSWLDNIKGRIANEIVDILFQYTNILQENDQASLLQEVTQRILSADDMNERALYMEISMFINQGKSNLAKYLFESFCANYQKFYDEAYPYDFDKFLQLSVEKPDKFA